MKILLINYAFFLMGGPERYYFKLKQLLLEKGHEVIDFSMKSNNMLDSQFSQYFANSINQDGSWFFSERSSIKSKINQIIRLFYSFEVRRKLDKLIKETNPDLAIVLHFKKKLSPSIIHACKNNKLPIFVRISDYLMLCPQAHFYRGGNICELCLINKNYSVIYKCVQNSFIYSLLWRLADIYYDLAGFDKIIDRFLVTNLFMKKKMVNKIDDDKICILPTFVDIREDMIQNYSLKWKNNTICYVSKLVEHKGIKFLLSNYDNILKFNKNILIEIMGRDDENLLDEISPGYYKNIKFINHSSQKEVLNLLAKSMYLIFPVQWYENLPNVVLESLSVGTPVILPRIGSLIDMIEDGRHGFFYEYNSKSDFMNVIKKALIIDNKKYNMMQRNCFELINSSFNKDDHYNSLMANYMEVNKSWNLP